MATLSKKIGFFIRRGQPPTTSSGFPYSMTPLLPCSGPHSKPFDVVSISLQEDCRCNWNRLQPININVDIDFNSLDLSGDFSDESDYDAITSSLFNSKASTCTYASAVTSTKSTSTYTTLSVFMPTKGSHGHSSPLRQDPGRAGAGSAGSVSKSDAGRT